MVRPEFVKVSDFVWEIPKTFKKGMLVPSRIVASKQLLDSMEEKVFDQVTNMSFLPGIQEYSLCMADGHQGYGPPIGGVAAFDLEEGIISPGAIGFDINCGMRLVTTNLTIKDVQPKLNELVNLLFERVPTGVGRKGFVKVDKKEFDKVMVDGVKWCVDNGYGWKKDLAAIEAHGKIEGALSEKVSQKARDRGINQLGTLGSGNHYLEIQVVKKENIFDEETAKAFGIFPGQIVVMVHCGSRGFGHQIATDYLNVFDEAMKQYKISI
ncbi:MAG: RtcB family protein, partial [Candidatus Diapherotrites archaeon]|nr:RtcB family protein [Candidatus Diapherotrites archaeon]